MKLIFPIFFEWYGLMPHMKYVNMFVIRVFSHTFPLLWKLTYPWVSVSREIPTKALHLEYFCFPIIFPYYRNSLFPCLGNCMNFYFTCNIQETQNSVMLVFSHTFAVRREFTFPMFLGIVCISAYCEICKKTIDLGMFCFLILFL